MPTTKHTHKTEYTNETSEVVMLANGIEVLAVGQAEIKEVEAALTKKYSWWQEDLGSTPYSLIEYVLPGETVKNTWTHMHIWISPEERANTKNLFEELF